MGGSPFTLSGSRIANATRTWQAAEDADVTEWDKTNDFIFAIAAESGAHATAEGTLQIKWRNVTDGGSFALLGSSGELTWSGVTDLVNGNAVTSGEAGCTGSGTWQDGIEREGANDCVTNLPKAYWTEHQWAVDCSNAHDGDKYEFELYDATEGASVGTCLADITMASGAQTYTKTFTSDAILQATETKTLTSDAFLQKTFTKTLSADARLIKEYTKALTTDAILKATKTKPFTADALLQDTFTKTLTADALLEKTYTKTFASDAVLEATSTKTFAADAYLKATKTKTFTVDAILESGGDGDGGDPSTGGGTRGVYEPPLQLRRSAATFPFLGLRKFYYSQTFKFLGLTQLSGMQSFRWKAVGSIVPLAQEYFIKARRDELEMSFARWPTREACVNEQQQLGHDKKDAETICSLIGERAEKGALFKAVPETPVTVVSKMADDDAEMVVVGWGTYELKDPQNDVITTQGQVRALYKWFNQVPEDYRHIHYKHTNFIGGKPLLSYKAPDGKTYYSHVNEKGTIIVAKVRPNDGLRLTRELRRSIRQGFISMFSIAADPVNYEVKMEKGEKVTYHYDLDPIEYTFCVKGVNPKARFEHVFEGQRIIKDAVEKTIVERDGRYCLLHHTGPDKGKTIKCFNTKAEALAMHRAIMANKALAKDERPPKRWWDNCTARAASFADDPDAFCGDLWHNGPPEKRESFGKALTSEELFQSLLRKHRVNWNES